MSNEAGKLSHLLELVAPDNDDPAIPPKQGVKLLAKIIKALVVKLDADAGVTDVDYESSVDAITL